MHRNYGTTPLDRLVSFVRRSHPTPNSFTPSFSPSISLSTSVGLSFLTLLAATSSHEMVADRRTCTFLTTRRDAALAIPSFLVPFTRIEPEGERCFSETRKKERRKPWKGKGEAGTKVQRNGMKRGTREERRRKREGERRKREWVRMSKSEREREREGGREGGRGEGKRERDRKGECRMRNRKTEIQFDRIG